MTTGIIILEVTITVFSARGTIQNGRPRRFIPTLLHIRVGVFVIELLSLIVKTILAAQPSVLSEDSHCDNISVSVTVSRIVVVVTWFIFFGVFLSVLIYLDPCHCYSAKLNFELIESEKDDNSDVLSKDNHMSIHHARNRWKLTHTVWEKRFRLMCGCFAGTDEHHQIAYKELAEIFASIFCDSNLVLSDIAAGLILVQKEHIEREFFLRNEPNDPQCVEYSIPLNFSDSGDRKIFEDAVHFLKFALGTYTWPIFMYMNPCGCFKLCSRALMCPCLKYNQRIRIPGNVVKDNSCFCGYAGLLGVTDLNEADIIYASFENDLYRVPFVVILDHSCEVVVVAIRGTLSIQDIITDMVAAPHQIKLPNQPKFNVHKGMYHTASWIRDELDGGILSEAFSKVPSYKLVIVGHSLGSGCACLLAMLLKEQYDDLKCFCFSPTGSLLNADAAAFSQSFVTSVTLGQDLIARLNIHTASTLNEDVIRVLKKCQKPKYRILLEGLLETLGKCCGRHVLFKEDDSSHSHEGTIDNTNDVSPLLITDSESHAYESFHTDSEGENNGALSQSSAGAFVPSCQLYPPGRIIHLVDTMETRGGFFNERVLEPRWVSSSSFLRIVVSPDMVRDHFPDVIYKALNTVWDQKKDEMTEVRVDTVFNN